jgi:hypothetical protein
MTLLPEYKFLEPHELIEQGDEFWTGTVENGGKGHWHPCKISVGHAVQTLTYRPFEVRRRVRPEQPNP